MHRIVAVSLLLGLAVVAPAADDSRVPATVSSKVEGLEKIEGYFPLYWDAATGEMWLEVSRLGEEFLYLESLATGIGSNDIGLDRGQIGRERVVRFDRSGPKLLLLEPNYGYRAVTQNESETRAVEESFAESVLWGFEVTAEQDGRLLVDATNFFLRDAHGVARRLKQTKQGDYHLDASRSAFYRPRIRAFPKNTEVEVMLTFTGEPKGDWIRGVAPTPEAVTIREHYSLVALPGPGYEPRRFDPRAGYFGTQYRDYAAPLGRPIEQRFIKRHRLKKRNPAARVSAPVEPIVYYLDPGVPEPVRSALLEGARWWDQAFAAAGYRGAFRVEMLPADADPMDIRYNVIQWVHRSTRGWSYGSSVVDPRTGEIIKGKVSLGSLRGRQDYLIAEALLAPYEEAKPAPPAMREMALARLRQLAAHEVGHTLGLAHNYIASTQGRASVMDYPHPLIKLTPAGDIDLSAAYATGIGKWDKVAIRYGYQDFPEGTGEPAALAKIIEDARGRGLTFLTDQDARPRGSAHPSVHLWDNGTDAAGELNRLMKVRARALERFSEKNIPSGRPMATLEEVLVPLYLLHRYQTEAAAKMIGGLEYTYAMRGDGQTPTKPVPANRQRAAFDALLATIRPEALTLPERIIQLIPPHPMGYPRTRESFPARTGLTFDPLSAAEVAANHTLGLLLDPARSARLLEQHAQDAAKPGFAALLRELIERTWNAPRLAGFKGEIQRVVEAVMLYHLFRLGANDRAPAQVRGLVRRQLALLAAKLEGPSRQGNLAGAAELIRRFLEEPGKVHLPKPLEAPPGQPI